MQADLAKIKFWNKLHNARKKILKEPNSKVLIFLKECIYFSYSQYELFFKIFPQFLKPGQRIVEIGSAPGRSLVIINKLFGSKVFGVENSFIGFKQNQELFKKNGLNKNNIIRSDFFKLKTSKRFDVVFSNGFVEHYTNPSEVIKRQTLLLNDNGIIICIIPNFSNLNYFIQRKMDRNNLSVHNLNIMNIESFEKLFSGFNKLYLSYYGTFSFRIFQTENRFLKMIIILLKPLRLIFNPLGIVFSWFVSTRHFTSSPFLIYIGSKKNSTF